MMSSSSSSNEPPPPPNPVLTAYEGFVQNTPLVMRYILSIQVISYLASWFVNPQYALANIPHFVLYRFELYRLVLSPLVNTSILSLIFAFWSFLDHGKRLEFSLGSTAFGWLCLMIGGLTNVLFLVSSIILWILSNREPAYLFISAQGIWLILFGIIAMECAQAPRDSKRKLFVWDIPTHYYPLALYLLFALLGNGLSMSYLISIGLGYAYGFGKLDSLKLSSTRARRWEETLLVNFTRREGWVVGQAATGSAAWNDVETAGLALPLFRPPQSQAAPVDDGSRAGSVFRTGNNTSETQAHSSEEADFASSSGRTLGGTARRGDARQARLQALERRTHEGL